MFLVGRSRLAGHFVAMRAMTLVYDESHGSISLRRVGGRHTAAADPRSVYNNIPILNRKCLPESHESCVCYGIKRSAHVCLVV